MSVTSHRWSTAKISECAEMQVKIRFPGPVALLFLLCSSSLCFDRSVTESFKAVFLLILMTADSDG